MTQVKPKSVQLCFVSSMYALQHKAGQKPECVTEGLLEKRENAWSTKAEELFFCFVLLTDSFTWKNHNFLGRSL